MRYDASKTLFSYWNRLRGDRNAPERSEIEPSDIRSVLGDTFILEVNNTMRTVSFRLAGTKLCNIHGRELKGYGYLGLWDETDNLKIIRAISRVYMDFTPVVISHTGYASRDRCIEFETLILPLLPTHDGSIRILGISTPRSVPYWLGADAITNNVVNSIRNAALEPHELTVTPSLVPTDGELQIRQNDQTDDPGSRQVKHLRVIEGGKPE